MRNLRRIMQIIFLLFFIIYLIQPLRSFFGEWLVKSDLLIIGSALSSRVLPVAALFSLFVLAVALIWGRAFCGWACPMGTLVDGFDWVVGRPPRAQKCQTLKYYVGVAMGVAAIGGVSLFWLLDPINWAGRIGSVFVPRQAEFYWLLGFGSILFAIEWLFGRRGFCRILCPLGAFLGGLAKISSYRFKVGSSCVDCGKCVEGCRMAAFKNKPHNHDRTACIQCRDCEALCPTNAISFHSFGPLHWGKPNLSRRSFLFSLVGGAGITVAMRSGIGSAENENLTLRPPGAEEGEDFANLCIRCGSCIRVCPTGGLHAETGQSGLRFLQTPYLSGRDGGCAYDCNACGQVCPTGAIKPIKLPLKQKRQIGVAKIQRKSCVVFEKKQPCLVCFTSCPVAAIKLDTSHVVLSWGEALRLPRILPERCIGCGICEAACPVPGEGAIRTYGIDSQSELVHGPSFINE